MMTSEKKRTYFCSVCGKNLSSSVALASHVKIHSGIKSFCCEYCGALYSTKQNLKAHLFRKHDINIDSIRSCDICGKQFFRKCAFDTHYLIHLKKKPFSCHICNKHFRQKITRDLHLATHTGDYKYSCSNCSKKFLSAYKWKQHVEKKRGLCSFSLSQSNIGDLNLKNNETEELIKSPKFDCQVTGQTFNCLNLGKGRVIEFFCSMPQCSKISFRNKTLLKKHISNAHLSNGILHHNEVTLDSLTSRILPSEKAKNQTSEIIEKGYSNKLKNDSSNSAQFSCTECSKFFKSLQGLEYHKKAHRGCFNFICDICGKLFIRNSHFVSHMKTHSNMRPFSCSFCRKSYKSNKNLKEHLRLKHPT